MRVMHSLAACKKQNQQINCNLFDNLCISLTLCCFCFPPIAKLCTSLPLSHFIFSSLSPAFSSLHSGFSVLNLGPLSLLAVGASSRCLSGSLSPRMMIVYSPQFECYVSLSLRVFVCLSCLYECSACLFCVCVAWCGPLSRSPWWRGDGVAQVLPFGQHLKLLNVLLGPSSSLMFYNLFLSS